MAHAPFAQMQPVHVRQFVAAACEDYYAPGEVLLEPAMGPVRSLLLLRRGRVTGRRGAGPTGSLQYEPGELFPVGALLAARPVRSTYTAQDDCFCLRLPADAVQALARDSTPFADFLERRALHFFELARQALRETYASEALHEQALEAPLSTLRRKAVLSCTADIALAQALAQMHDQGVGLGCGGGRAANAAGHRHAPRHPRPRDLAGAAAGHPDRCRDECAGARARGERDAAGRGAADVAPWRAPCAGVRTRRAGRHRVGARPVRAAAPVAQGLVDAHPCGGRSPDAAARGARHPALRAQSARPRRASAPADRTDQPSERSADRLAGAAAGARTGHRPAARVLAGVRLRGPQRTDDRHGPGQRTGVRERRSADRPPCMVALCTHGERCARCLRLSPVQGQRDGQQPAVLPHARANGRRALRSGSSTARRRIC